MLKKLSMKLFQHVNDLIILMMNERPRSSSAGFKKKGYGRKRIQFELNLKGLGGKNIETVISKSISDADECQGAERIYQKHARRFNREKDELKRKDKIYKFLYGRGFSQVVISEVINKIGSTT